MANRGPERKICTCGKFKTKGNKCKSCNSHHTRPRSRGGNDGSPNEVDRNIQEEHTPWHGLHGNMRVGEVARLVLFDWEIYNPHHEIKEQDTHRGRIEKRTSSWNTLYGKKATKRTVMEVVIKKFTRRNHDRKHIRRVLDEALIMKKVGKRDYDQLVRLLDERIKE